MRRSFLVALIMAALLLFASLPAVAAPTSVTIDRPTNNSLVSSYSIVAGGTVVKPADYFFAVVVQTPQNVWVVLPPPTVDNQGRWQLRLNLGDATNGNNSFYTIVAMITTVQLQPGPLPAGLPRSVTNRGVRVKREDLSQMYVKIHHPAKNATVQGDMVEIRGMAGKPFGVNLYVAVMQQEAQEWLIQERPEVLPSGQWNLAVKLGDADGRQPAKYRIRALLSKLELKKGDRFPDGSLPRVMVFDDIEIAYEPEKREKQDKHEHSWLAWLTGLAAATLSGLAARLIWHVGETRFRGRGGG